MSQESVATRNFALIGHSSDGKTSLGEALLFRAGALTQMGSVERGEAAFTTLPEERERQGSTIATSVYSFDWNGTQMSAVDTPGDPNFQAAGRIALHALDAAVLLVSAVEGARVGTLRMWRAARELGVSLLAFVNGLDRELADFSSALESLENMGAAIAPVTLALPAKGAGPRIVDLLAMRAVDDDGSWDIPTDVAEEVAQARQRLVEAVAEGDDALLERYLEEGDLDPEEIRRGLAAGVQRGTLLPVFAGVAISALGVDALLRGLVELLPAAGVGRAFHGREANSASPRHVEARADAPFAGLTFKTAVDRYSGTLSVIRVVAGTLQPDATVLDVQSGAKRRLSKLLHLRGNEHGEIAAAGPGSIVAVPKLQDVHSGDALRAEKGGLELDPIPIPRAVLSYAIQPKSKGEEDKIFASLARLSDEDPSLRVERDPRTGQFLLTGMGDLHIRVGLEKLKRIFQLEIDLERPKVPYRETIAAQVLHVEGKLKKQTGGKGMFGVCYLSLEPLPRGSGFEFSDEIVGGAIPRNLIPAVEKGVIEACGRGPLAGYPVVDVRVRCVDGKYHSVDSNEMAFKLAGSMGFKAAAEQAHPTLLEPIMAVEVTIPDQYMGDVIGDLNSRRGRVQATDSQAGATAVIKAQVPMAEMLEYASSLTSLTAGTGTFQMDFSLYEELPAHLREKVIAEAKAEHEAV